MKATMVYNFLQVSPAKKQTWFQIKNFSSLSISFSLSLSLSLPSLYHFNSIPRKDKVILVAEEHSSQRSASKMHNLLASIFGWKGP